MFIFLTSIRCILWVIILLNISQNVFGNTDHFLNFMYVLPSSYTTLFLGFQCYSCKSPLRGTIKGEFLRALQDFDNQPKEIADCAIPSDKLPKITCHSNVCMKTVFNPKDSKPNGLLKLYLYCSCSKNFFF